MSASSNAGIPKLQDVLKTYWGYDSFLPLQQESMSCVLEGRDSVVVLPTGGGKSLCYQAPAMCREGLTVVVSPLIALMKDQVDGLNGNGVPAACINSSLSHQEKREVAEGVRSGVIRLLYVAPERLVMPSMLTFLVNETNVTMFAIDEAHCISSWGHDFRPEFRQLQILKETFPGIGIHAFTATASQRVQEDIARQLHLDEPRFLVGSFDRPNLTYRVQRRDNRLRQIRQVVDRHPREAGIIYCISRADVERTAQSLAEAGYRARPYHAGLEDDVRHRNQDAFLREDCDIIVATIAFGMGIDKSNVRYVIHAGMPKSLENYQQESGRAGRDGLEAECVLFYSGNDFHVWKAIVEGSDVNARESALRSLSAMYEFCGSVTCRHRSVIAYFGQELEGDSCNACDVCLEELAVVDDAQTIAQKVLSCVVRLEQRYGAEYTAQVLCGSRDQRILQAGHDTLSTWGLLVDEGKRSTRDWIEQLVEQGALARVGEYNTLQVTEQGRKVLRGESVPRLLKPKPAGRASQSEPSIAPNRGSWEGVDRELFDVLRDVRNEKARDRGIPAYMVFNDAALRDMAARKPATLDAFLEVKGVGKKKCHDYGEEFVGRIVAHCDSAGLRADVSTEG